ncbi:MAG: hypothetical protein JEY97_07370 [Bacteroidales bacterium]|nr:hypothetical protein [Bacteroidales bacterium]
MKFYFNLWLGENAFSLLPQREVSLLYKLHFTPPRLLVAEGSRVSKKMLMEFKKSLCGWLDFYTLEIADELPKITLNHFFTYYLSIIFFLRKINEDDFANAKELKEKFKKLDETGDKTIKNGYQLLDNVLLMLGLVYSDPLKCFYWLNWKVNDEKSKIKGLFIFLKINIVKPITMDFIVKGDKRPAYRYGVPLNRTGIFWQTYKPPDKGSFRWKEELEIYIQSHAIKRLYERVELIDPIFMRYFLFYSLRQPKMFYEKNFLLIPYQMEHVVIGYFIADITQGKILIRTFLFLTNEGTPEARRLKENTGLMKADIKYLKIHKLKAFVESDIVKNERIKNIFIEAGCGGLFNLRFDHPDAYSGKIKLAEEMTKYLEIKDENELLEPC